MVEEFGPGVLAADGSLDRPALGAIVFADPQRLQALNAIVHPLVRARSAELEAAAADDTIVVHDIPLLAENGLESLFEQVIVVDADEDVRLDRLVRLRGMPEAEARSRMAAQATREQRLAIADLVVENNGTLAELEQRVNAVWEQLTSS